MNLLIGLLFFISLNSQAASKRPHYDCANIKVAAVDFSSCYLKRTQPEAALPPHGKDVNDYTNTTFLENKTYLKYEKCSVNVLEDGTVKRYNQIERIGMVECTPAYQRNQTCSTPEDRLYLHGPLCRGNTLGENCIFSLERAYSAATDNAYVDSRKQCQCNYKGCGHLIADFVKADKSVFTAKEKLDKLNEVKLAFRKVAPGCDDLVVTDISMEKTNVAMYAVNSLKCSVHYPTNPKAYINNTDCPQGAVAVRRVFADNEGANKIFAQICSPKMEYVTSPGS